MVKKKSKTVQSEAEKAEKRREYNEKWCKRKENKNYFKKYYQDHKEDYRESFKVYKETKKGKEAINRYENSPERIEQKRINQQNYRRRLKLAKKK